jgi:dihydrofolate synthase/folylpolyglutamate synthase
MENFSSYEEAREWLYGLRNRGSRYGIERMMLLAKRLGNPERRFPSIHVAGTNGKGSVCAMLERVYRAGGYRTGLFTSPHLLHQGERIQLDGVPMKERDILRRTNGLLPVAIEMEEEDPENPPSFFEWMTAMAFQEFEESRVDIAIIETGLGGRLDSTNVLVPMVSVITSVGLDHVEILGNTIQEIAREKGGIIKPGVPVVLGRMPDGAREVLEGMARERNCDLVSVGDCYSQAELPKTNLAGQVQRWNAGVAKIVTKIIIEEFPLEAGVFRDGIMDVGIRGRWSTEQDGSRKIIFDGAHNSDALDALCQNLEALEESEGKKPVIVAGFTGNPDRPRDMLPSLKARSSRLLLVRPSHDRGLDPETYSRGESIGNLETMFPCAGKCSVLPEDSTVVVTGSLYLVAEVLGRLGNTTGHGQLGLQD